MIGSTSRLLGLGGNAARSESDPLELDDSRDSREVPMLSRSSNDSGGQKDDGAKVIFCDARVDGNETDRGVASVMARFGIGCEDEPIPDSGSLFPFLKNLDVREGSQDLFVPVGSSSPTVVTSLVNTPAI